MLALVNEFLLANVSEQIVRTVQAYVGPIFLLIVGIVAITFLFQRQIMQFTIFLVIAILIAILFYTPGIVKTIAEAFTGETGISTGGFGG